MKRRATRIKLRKLVRRGLRLPLLLFALLLVWKIANSAKVRIFPVAANTLQTDSRTTLVASQQSPATFLSVESEPVARPSPVVAIAPPQVLQQGNTIVLNGKAIAAPWLQWQEGNAVRTGISDTAIASSLGLQLLSTPNPTAQSVQWDSNPKPHPLMLRAFLRLPYRYLDLSKFATVTGLQLQAQGNKLILTFPTAKIEKIRQGHLSRNRRLILDLDRSTFWRVSRDRVTLEGAASEESIQHWQAERSELFFPFSLLPASPPVKVTASGSQTTFKFQVPAGKSLNVSTLSNPPRLTMEVEDEEDEEAENPFIEREIRWARGITVRQNWVGLGSDRFPVVSLEIEPRAGVALRPIWGNANGMEGIEPLKSMAPRWQAIAAVNGGFFNRNTKLPLGAIRRDGRWYSGPILYRGAIAWDDGGNFKIGRLHLQETLTTASGQRIPVLHLNSGYVQAGLSRYTPEWGYQYVPLADNEIMVVVQGNQVIQQYQGGEAGKSAVPIPRDGYLLTIRANSVSPTDLAIGTTVSISSATVPPEFANYPHIMGAGPVLLQNGRVVLDALGEKFSSAFNRQAAPRSAIATTSRGTLLIAAIHSRDGGKGPTLGELAQLMRSLGAVDALNLDGGSSTSLFLGGQLIDRDPTTAARVHNGIGIYLANP